MEDFFGPTDDEDEDETESDLLSKMSTDDNEMDRTNVVNQTTMEDLDPKASEEMMDNENSNNVTEEEDVSNQQDVNGDEILRQEIEEYESMRNYGEKLFKLKGFIHFKI